MWRLTGSIFLLSLSGCAWWQAGINNPDVVHHAIVTVQPYKEVADSIYPHAGTILMALAVPFLILLGGRKKANEQQG